VVRLNQLGDRMNSKLIGYDEAVEKIKDLEQRQHDYKRVAKLQSSQGSGRNIYQSSVDLRKVKINTLLSIIAAHKQARRMYGVLREIQDSLGISTKERKLVDGIVND
jgi:hypothetical protein